MPDLATALAGLYSGGDMTIFQATVDAVGQGVVTVHFNGGTFTDVPYLDMMITGHAWPSVGDACYVIGRKDWGMLVLGRPAPGPVRAGSDPVVALWEPVTLDDWQRTAAYPGGHYVVASGGLQHATPDDGSPVHNDSAAVWFYSGDPTPAGASLSTASIHLTGTWTQPGPFGPDNPAMDWSYFEIGLHSSPVGSSTFVPMENLNATARVSSSFDIQLSLSLDWMARLRNGTAKGIYVRMPDFPMVLSGSGELRLTTL
jgi:hypothetical protein